MATLIPWRDMKIGRSYWQEVKGEEEVACFLLVAKPFRARYLGLFDDFDPEGVRAEIDWSEDCRYWDDEPMEEERESESWQD